MSNQLDDNPFVILQQILSKQAEQFDKQVGPFVKQGSDSWDQFSKMLQAGIANVGERTIQTKTQGQGTALQYTTNMKLDGSVLNEFPSNIPVANDLYWIRHNALVDKILADRQETINKVIDTIGTTVKGLVNPISFSPVDLVKLAELFKKTQ